MFELKFRHFFLVFDFTFFATVALMSVIRDNRVVMLGLITCLWHEFGHLILMFLCKVNIQKVIFYGAGIKIVPDRQFAFTPFKAQFWVYAAGSMTNFLTAFLLSDSTDGNLQILASVNALIGAFNLLPLKHLDGGKLILLFIYKYCCIQRAILLERYLKWINAFLILIVLLVVCIIGIGNITMFVTLGYLLVSTLIYE